MNSVSRKCVSFGLNDGTWKWHYGERYMLCTYWSRIYIAFAPLKKIPLWSLKARKMSVWHRLSVKSGPKVSAFYPPFKSWWSKISYLTSLRHWIQFEHIWKFDHVWNFNFLLVKWNESQQNAPNHLKVFKTELENSVIFVVAFCMMCENWQAVLEICVTPIPTMQLQGDPSKEVSLNAECTSLAVHQQDTLPSVKWSLCIGSSSAIKRLWIWVLMAPGNCPSQLTENTYEIRTWICIVILYNWEILITLRSAFLTLKKGGWGHGGQISIWWKHLN